MTPAMAEDVRAAQDSACLMAPTEATPTEVIGWSGPVLSMHRLALLPLDWRRGADGMWTRGYLLQHTSGDSCEWFVQSADGDHWRALADACRVVLLRPVTLPETDHAPVRAPRRFGRGPTIGESVPRFSAALFTGDPAASAAPEPESAPWEDPSRYGPTITVGPRPFWMSVERPPVVPTAGDARIAALDQGQVNVQGQRVEVVPATVGSTSLSTVLHAPAGGPLPVSSPLPPAGDPDMRAEGPSGPTEGPHAEDARASSADPPLSPQPEVTRRFCACCDDVLVNSGAVVECRGCSRVVCLRCTLGTPKRLRCRACYASESTATHATDTPPVLTPEERIAVLDAVSAEATVSPESEAERASAEAAGPAPKARRHRWAPSVARHTHCEKCGVLKGYPPGASLGVWSWSADGGATWAKGAKLPPCCERKTEST